LEGWGAFVLKEKLKNLKKGLKEWNVSPFGHTNRVKGMIALDLKEEESQLSEADILRRNQLHEDFWKVVRRIDSTLCEKAKSRWFLEGDRNSKYFHSFINWKGRKNNLRGFVIDEE